MVKWIINKKFKEKLKLKAPILISGLPGIGSVGKIVVDFMIDSLEPQMLYEIYSHSFPHSVFISDNNLIDMPSVSIYGLKTKKKDFLILAGDVQPAGERASYEFCEKVLDLAEEFGCKEILTLGGIGLSEEPKAPKIYGIGTDEQVLGGYKKKCSDILCKDSKATTIVGAAGLLLGLGKLRGWKGASLLVETSGHPFHLGFKEASTMINKLNSVLDINLDINLFEKEIHKEAVSREKEENQMQKKALMQKFRRFKGEGADVNYIG